MRAGTHRDRAPEETKHGGRKTPKNQKRGRSGDRGTEEKGPQGKRHDPYPGKGIPQWGDQRRPPQHAPPKQASDAVRITPAHTHQPPQTTRGMGGTPTRGERATPTEEAAEKAAAQRTTTPSPPGDDPGRHKGNLTGTGRGLRHGHSNQG